VRRQTLTRLPAGSIRFVTSIIRSAGSPARLAARRLCSGELLWLADKWGPGSIDRQLLSDWAARFGNTVHDGTGVAMFGSQALETAIGLAMLCLIIATAAVDEHHADPAGGG
jgi:hypothetical protein